MNMSFSFLSAGWQRFVCHLGEARRLRRGMNELAQMGAHELRDIGFSHPAIASAAAAAAPSRCW